MRVLLFLLLTILPSAACLWDRDTLQEEAKANLDTVKAITGWFDRYPARYYEMRLDRVTKELESNPGSLDLYDDAGVACSRLGRHAESIAWMEKKKTILDSRSPDETKEERYRYLSNIGTFYLIRWIVQPEEKRSNDLTDLKASEGFIKQALELNPDAHFGREKFQWMLIRWLLSPAPGQPDSTNNFLGLQYRMWSRPDGGGPSPDGFTYEEARKGITGLIQLGAAWESVDSFHALQRCLDSEGLGAIGFLAFLRERELYESGARSLHPSPDVRAELFPQASEFSAEKPAITAFFKHARAAATKREGDWLAYQDERFRAGMHPDTHPDFWKDWREPKFPKMPGPTFEHFARRHPGLVLISMGFLGLFGIIVMVVFIKKLQAYLRRNSWH